MDGASSNQGCRRFHLGQIWATTLSFRSSIVRKSLKAGAVTPVPTKPFPIDQQLWPRTSVRFCAGNSCLQHGRRKQRAFGPRFYCGTIRRHDIEPAGMVRVSADRVQRQPVRPHVITGWFRVRPFRNAQVAGTVTSRVAASKRSSTASIASRMRTGNSRPPTATSGIINCSGNRCRSI